MKCKCCGHEIEEWTKIPELNIEVSQIKEWKESYNELLKNIPKGCRLMKVWEIFKINELEIFDKIFNEKSVRYYCEQLPVDKKEKWGRWVYLGGSSYLGSIDVDLAYSVGDGRVVFVRDLK